MENLIQETIYGLTGEFGMVARVIELTKEGHSVCPDATHSVGLGTYMIAYEEGLKEDSEEGLKEDSEEGLKEDSEEGLKEDSEEGLAVVPDFTLAKSILESTGSEAEAKAELIIYASSFEGIDEAIFDKRKSFAKLLATFQGKWGYISRTKANSEESE